ncbi:MAG TPA: helix-turn-helix domain-containing protein [Candidatus Andersenbacteria bacterium]|nr:helix-turn-helix domain-containing protein [Candidatus Andersenbacteria bacterium]
MVGVRPGKGEHHEGIGDRLRRERLVKHLSLEEVSSQLHIPLNQLLALESDDYSIFSAELYARGAYSAYEKFLGIDTNTSSHAFLRSLSSVRQHIPLTLHTPASWLERLIHPTVILTAVGLFLALLVGGYIAWQLESFWRLPDVIVSEPIDSVITGDHVMISGTTEDKAQVTINEENILLRTDSSFSVPLILHTGINTVRIEAKNSAGRVRTKQLFLLRS